MNTWTLFWGHFRWEDAVDILLVSFFLYAFLWVLREARATRAALGFAFLFFSGTLAGKMGFYTLEWLVHNLWPVLVISFVIVFQPDIRRFLIQAGKGRFFSSNLKGESEVFRAVTEAVRRMVKNKWGALIVLERNDVLQELVDTGVRIDGEVTSDLLVTLFNPRSPLHDGAVVIRQGKVAAAGCILPLSQNPSLQKSYGTRHRAAIGVTEETDALAVVVSEEKHFISFAIAGKITPEIDPETLEEMLTLYGARLTA